MSGLIFQAATEVSVGERDGTIKVTVRRTGDLSQAVNVVYDVTAENATAGVDFTGSSGVLRIEAGADQASVNFGIINDNLSEATETFVFSLVGIDSGTLSVPRTTRINILDDENPVLPPSDPPLVSPYRVNTETFVSGLTQPLNFEFSPIDPKIAYVAEKGGRIRVVNIETGADLGDFADLRSIVSENNDRGLMDIALHPDFPNTPYMYAFYVVDPEGAGQDVLGNRYAHVVRFTADAASGYQKVVPDSGVVIAGQTGRSTADINGGGLLDFTLPTYSNELSSEQYQRPNDPNPPLVVGGFKQNYIKVDSITHAGGSLAFRPDGMLYISTGDGSSPNYADPHATHVQNINSLSGKILRVDPITGQGLTDNPYYQSGQSLDANASKVYQSGLRNPFSIAFDNLGRLFIADTGWKAYEEVNHGAAGANFGWPYYEGREGGRLAQATGYSALPTAAAFYASVANGSTVITAPYVAFGHATAVAGYANQVITGGAVIYDGDKYPAALQNDFFFTNFESGHTFTVDTYDRTAVNYLFTATSGFAPIHFNQAEDGYVYYVDLVDGTLGRIYINDANVARVTVSAAANVSEASANVQATFTLSAAQQVATTVTYSTANGSATAGSDFSGRSNATVIIPAGQTSVSVQIPLIDDTVSEGIETFQVRLDGAMAGTTKLAAFGGATVNIIDNDAPAGTNLLVNGSFEATTIPTGSTSYSSVPGWTALTGGQMELWKAHRNVTATDGVNFAELDFDTALDGFYQDVSTVAGQALTLTFDLRRRVDFAVTTPGIEVLWNGQVVATTTPGANWGTFTVSNIVGTGGLDRLTIRELQSESGDGRGALIDNFRLIAAGPVAPAVSVSANAATVGEGAGTAGVTFTLNAVQSNDVTVTYSTVNGTAVAGSDFTGATNATATILAGQTSTTVQIPILNDMVAEPTESFSVSLVGATLNGNAIQASGSAAITITDNDVAPSVSVSANPSTVAEAAGANAGVTFTLNAVQSNDVTVTYSTVNGTAVAGSDFTGATNATATILAGQTSTTVQIPLINDNVAEASESFSVNLVGATLNGNAIQASGSAAITITDNDAPPSGTNLLVNGSFETATVPAGGTANFASITGWTAISGGQIELWKARRGVSPTNGTNFAELDFAAAWDGFYQDVQTVAGQSHSLTFDLRRRSDIANTTPGIEILWNGQVVATTTPGANWGSFTVSNLVGTGGLDRLTIRELQSESADGVGALLDNFRLVSSGGPVQPTVSIAASPATVAEAAGANAGVTFTLSAAQASNVTVTYSTVNGTAVAGSDFTGATNATATILAGQTSTTVQIPILNDNVAEASESFSVNLVGATLNGNAIPASGSAAITITDNDAPPSGTNLLVNGSFETATVPAGASANFASIAGWTAITGGRIELWKARRGVAPTDGTNFAELDFDTALDGFYQDVQTVAGQSHSLTFDMRRRTDIANTTPGIEVLWNGQVVATTTPGTTGWGSFTVSNLVGTGGLDRLTIRELQSESGDGVGALLDNFKLVATAAAPLAAQSSGIAGKMAVSSTEAAPETYDIASFLPGALATIDQSGSKAARGRADYLYEPDLGTTARRSRTSAWSDLFSRAGDAAEGQSKPAFGTRWRGLLSASDVAGRGQAEFGTSDPY
jgi:glucose/arabinose dehydrogenase/uncharacterized protein (DUF427 family)